MDNYVTYSTNIPGQTKNLGRQNGLTCDTKHPGEYDIDRCRSDACFKDFVARTQASIYIDLMDINTYLLKV